MSCLNLTVLVMQRRQEIEEQLRVFVEKCDCAVREIERMKHHARTLPDQLNCDPSEIKNKYLSCMNQLVAYNYDIKMILDILDVSESSSTDCTPVQDIPRQHMKPLTPICSTNLMDVLSEPMPSTSKACSNQCPVEKPVKRKIRKEEQVLIAFSSTSSSSESVPSSRMEKEVQCELSNDLKKLTLNDSQPSLPPMEECNLPKQNLLQQDCTYSASITHIDGLSLWVVTDIVDAHNLMLEMKEYYKAHTMDMCLNEMMSLTYCIYAEEENFLRAFFMRLTEEDMSVAEVFLLDTGETCHVPTSAILPLVPQFCNKPPFARCCHFAGVDLLGRSTKAVDQFLEPYVHATCQITIDDKYVLQFQTADSSRKYYTDSSESLGVYVKLSSGLVLNDLLVQRGLVKKIEDKTTKENTSMSAVPVGLPELSESNLDITDCPEYEDALVAVTGYHNRDEENICKHYKGGPEKTCFKGARCQKKHIIMNPDGWTSDQVAVVVKCPSLPLPAPGTTHSVTIKYIEHYNSFYVHFEDQINMKETLPEFGVVLPPTTLKKLVTDMNSPATRLTYRPYKLVPAPGELVAALYPMDGNWYRARVIQAERASQNVEVMYIDYGNRLCVREDQICELDQRFLSLPAQAVRCVLAGVSAKTADTGRMLEAKTTLFALIQERTLQARVMEDQICELDQRFLSLPAQAVRCVLAGVSAKTADTGRMLEAKTTLFALIQERTLQARVISRGLDELTVELLDQGFSVAEQFAASKPGLIALHDYTPEDDTTTRLQIIPG